ncbi:pyruvate phosphate dikinase [Sulfobacillus thermosulfidooxidans DSM 9293]|uniref:Pyruvate, phosphate dikinase n=1 Tax=Sulfobacillus thermosulfidooxidans (strain DSM 9293 / VKM B-1269 / AT-1) TaxID=929705 RepID=A0A1W1W869_SULTA|nr:pyruvate, phosphate dikinase [Sulfobacillus thermosulfidooxidans]SMC02474.1 pyruvate phosphate dikinase [Sulfobacillus thermosulfidooxidans DSM 9293]
MSRYVFPFEQGRANQRDLLGGKGAGLAEMSYIGLPVPPGFTITTEACNLYQELGQFPDGMMDEVWENLRLLEQKLSRTLGDPEKPLLVSVRSGAPISMPGMMDTVLNLGLNTQTTEGLARLTQNRRFALDSYRRFIQMFGNVVMHMEHHRFEHILQEVKDEAGVTLDPDLSESYLEILIARYKDLVREVTGREFPENAHEQLEMAIKAVFDSWKNPRAIVYRRLNKIPETLGTAVNVQSMVFGNMGPTSATGVLFTRNPNTGEPGMYGEYLTNAQGEDVVAGIRTPKPIQEMAQEMPKTFQEITEVCALLEKHYRDMQDIEFTVEREKLYLLQTRTGKRTARAAVKIAVDLVREGIITREEAILRQDPDQVARLLYRQIDPSAKLDVLAQGLPASPGAASGKVVFNADEAEARGNQGEAVILVRPETTPDDIHGIVAAQGVLTSRGGMTSHAAIVARGMGKPAVTGCEAVRINLEEEVFYVGDVKVSHNDVITIDGGTGRVVLGVVPTVDPGLSEDFTTLLQWADDMKRLGVEANADTPEDAQIARDFGAQGVGLCRTEHMFMGQDRLPVMQKMILAETLEERQKALNELLPMQQSDFYGILKAMDGYPVTIRLLDPPLHEFLPNIPDTEKELALARQEQRTDDVVRLEAILRRARTLFEFNPMLGFRGVRLGIVYPEIYAMQAQAIFQAQAQLLHEGYHPVVEVMIPLVGTLAEFTKMKELIADVNARTQEAENIALPYKIGTMIEIPRAALTAGSIAEEAEFFSFGTNDLTQTTFGFSRDDAESKFLPHYLAEKILPDNPFMVLDREGVGRLIKIAVADGRETRPDLKVGICGEHGGDPSSIEFCHLAGLNYVSASPYRVPIARLAAAQANLRHPN